MAKKIKIEFKKKLVGNAWGMAYKDENRIEVKSSLKDLSQLDTIIHELQHIIHPFMDEEHVEKSSTILAQHLWQIGYRKQTL